MFSEIYIVVAFSILITTIAYLYPKTKGKMFKHDLGRKAKDTITGFEGTITGRSDYITGCSQYCLVPNVKEDGTAIDGRWFDEGRVEPLEETIEPETVQTEVNGGPNSDAPVCN